MNRLWLDLARVVAEAQRRARGEAKTKTARDEQRERSQEASPDTRDLRRL